MCFVFFLGSRSEPPRIPWSARQPAFWTGPPNAPEAVVHCQFSLPSVTHPGTDTGCWCSFRSATFQRGRWPEEAVATEPGDKPEEGSQPNHEAPAAFVRGVLATEPFVELYGCWWGDFQEPAQDRQEVLASRLADLGFFFHQRGHYRVRADR